MVNVANQSKAIQHGDAQERCAKGQYIMTPEFQFEDLEIMRLVEMVGGGVLFTTCADAMRCLVKLTGGQAACARLNRMLHHPDRRSRRIMVH